MPGSNKFLVQLNAWFNQMPDLNIEFYFKKGKKRLILAKIIQLKITKTNTTDKIIS